VAMRHSEVPRSAAASAVHAARRTGEQAMGEVADQMDGQRRALDEPAQGRVALLDTAQAAPAAQRTPELVYPLPCMYEATRSAIMMVGALVLPPIRLGMTEASTTRRPVMPRTLHSWSTTAIGSLSAPILQVPTG